MHKDHAEVLGFNQDVRIFSELFFKCESPIFFFLTLPGVKQHKTHQMKGLPPDFLYRSTAVRPRGCGEVGVSLLAARRPRRTAGGLAGGIGGIGGVGGLGICRKQRQVSMLSSLKQHFDDVSFSHGFNGC